MAKAKTTTTTTDVDYNALSLELAELMAQLEQGEQGVDAAVQAYERGLEIITVLEAHLGQAENRVTVLKAAADVAARKDEEE